MVLRLRVRIKNKQSKTITPKTPQNKNMYNVRIPNFMLLSAGKQSDKCFPYSRKSRQK